MASSSMRSQTERGRVYETPEGAFPSVTTILSVINKPALLNWAAKAEREMVCEASWGLYEDAPLSPGTKKMTRIAYMNTLLQRIGLTKAHDREKVKACEIGSQAHALIEWNMRREIGQVVGPEPRVGTEAANAFAQYEAWRASVKLEPVAIEQIVWNPHDGYAGTLDLVARVNGHMAILDYKTSRAVYDEYHLQLAAYGIAYNAMKQGVDVETGYIIRLPKQEGDGFEAVEVSDFSTPYRLFLHAKALWEWQDRSYQMWKAKQGKAA